MDDLLLDRVNQLKAIDDRLERITKRVGESEDVCTRTELRSLRREIADMIRIAEEEHAMF